MEHIRKILQNDGHRIQGVQVTIKRRLRKNINKDVCKSVANLTLKKSPTR